MSYRIIKLLEIVLLNQLILIFHQNSVQVTSEKTGLFNLCFQLQSVLSPKYDVFIIKVSMYILQGKINFKQSLSKINTFLNQFFRLSVDQVCYPIKQNVNEANMNQREKQVFNQLKKRGYSQNAIAGIMANICVQTGGTFDYKQKQKKGNAEGLFQFDSKKKQYNQYKKKHKLDDSAQNQIKFMDSTLHGTDEEKKVIGKTNAKNINQVFATGTEEECAQIFSDIWQRPGQKHMDRRLKKSKQFKQIIRQEKEVQEKKQLQKFTSPFSSSFENALQHNPTFKFDSGNDLNKLSNLLNAENVFQGKNLLETEKQTPPNILGSVNPLYNQFNDQKMNSPSHFLDTVNLSSSLQHSFEPRIQSHSLSTPSFLMQNNRTSGFEFGPRHQSNLHDTTKQLLLDSFSNSNSSGSSGKSSGCEIS